jgi:hypothetical protein
MPTPLHGSSAGYQRRGKHRIFVTKADNLILTNAAHWSGGIVLFPTEDEIADRNPNVHNFYLRKANPMVNHRNFSLWMFNDTKPHFVLDKKTAFTVIYSPHHNLFAIVSYRDYSVPFLLRPDEDSIPWDGEYNEFL